MKLNSLATRRLRSRLLHLEVLVLALGAALVLIGSGSSATADGDLIFKANWETGDVSQWSSTQCSNVSTPYATRGSVAVVGDEVAEGRYAGKFTLPADHEKRTQCEVLRRRSLAVGSEDYYGLALYFSADWREPSSAFWDSPPRS